MSVNFYAGMKMSSGKQQNHPTSHSSHTLGVPTTQKFTASDNKYLTKEVLEGLGDLKIR